MPEPPPPSDPFVRQLGWLIAEAGGKDALARASGNAVGVRTLDSWVRGGYPRQAVTGAVRDLDAWALAQDIGYPHAAAAPRLVASCGPVAARQVQGGPPAAVPPATGHRPLRRWALLAVGQLAVVAATAATTLVVTDRGAEPAEAAPGFLGVLPSEGDGTLRPQTVAGSAVTTFGDPRGLTPGGPGIPAGTTVDVRCRYWAPSLPAASPDGWWYLVDEGVWSGQWARANAFLNGDAADAPQQTPTDLTVPECTGSVSWTPAG